MAPLKTLVISVAVILGIFLNDFINLRSFSVKMGAPLKRTYISLLYFISLCRFAFCGQFCRLIEVERKGFADHTFGTCYSGEPGITRPQF